jgi:hypothetical protein
LELVVNNEERIRLIFGAGFYFDGALAFVLRTRRTKALLWISGEFGEFSGTMINSDGVGLDARENRTRSSLGSARNLLSLRIPVNTYWGIQY